jgi:hypothetical protein
MKHPLRFERTLIHRIESALSPGRMFQGYALCSKVLHFGGFSLLKIFPRLEVIALVGKSPAPCHADRHKKRAPKRGSHISKQLNGLTLPLVHQRRQHLQLMSGDAFGQKADGILDAVLKGFKHLHDVSG